MKNEKINNRQLWFILFIMRSTIMLAFLPVLTSADSRQDAWISTILVLLGSEMFVFLIAYLNTRFPELTIIEYSQIILGSWVGKLLGLVFLWLFLQASVVNIRIYGEMIVTSFMPNTPMLFVISVMVLAATICVYEGVEGLGRSADIVFFLFISMLAAVILVPLSKIDIRNLQPVFARGWVPVVKGALVPIALISQAWVLGMLAPTTIEPRKTIKTAMTSIGLSLVILAIVVFIVVGVMGASEGERANFPMLTMIRSIEVSDFLQRIEVLIVFAWGFGLFISISTFLYSGAKGFSQWLGLKDYRAIMWPMAIIWVILANYGFRDFFALFDFLKLETFASYGFAALLGPLVLLWGGYAVRLAINKMREGN